MSGRPSLLKSADIRRRGLDPEGKCDGARNEPSPLPRRIETELRPWLETARSRRPSPLKSRAITNTAWELPPSEMDVGGRKEPSPLPRCTIRCVGVDVEVNEVDCVVTRSSLPSPF